MQQKFKIVSLIVLLTIICLVSVIVTRNTSSVGKPITKIDKTRFIRIQADEAYGTVKIRNRGSGFSLQPGVGDFLSRIWALYGRPSSVEFEGFSYVFKDKKTGLIFTAYSAGSGPAYGGFPKDKRKLDAVINDFEYLVNNAKPADCYIEYETDFGRYRSGAKGGKPYDKLIESND